MPAQKTNGGSVPLGAVPTPTNPRLRVGDNMYPLTSSDSVYAHRPWTILLPTRICVRGLERDALPDGSDFKLQVWDRVRRAGVIYSPRVRAVLRDASLTIGLTSTALALSVFQEIEFSARTSHRNNRNFETKGAIAGKIAAPKGRPHILHLLRDYCMTRQKLNDLVVPSF